MIKHKQTIIHDPENGRYGDCFRTALASLMDFEKAEDVPHFLEDNPGKTEFWKRVDMWLESKGYSIFSVAYDQSLEDVLYYVSSMNPDTYFLLAGTSERGVDHQVIARNGEIVHDPALEDSGLVGPCRDGYFWVEVLCPVRFHK